MINTEMNKIIDKIQKLFALAGNNPSAEEARVALLKAQTLIAKYSIDIESVSSEETIKYELIETSVKRHKLNNTLGTIIANSFACRIIILSSNKLAFFGRSDNAKAAASSMEFIYPIMNKGGNQATKDAGHTPGHQGAAHYYNSYVIGFLNGLKEAMDAQTVALAIVVPQDVNDKFNETFPNRCKCRRSNTKAAYSRTIYEKGRIDGYNVMDKRSLPV